jgi:Cft2 family RNA processing exonuclease
VTSGWRAAAEPILNAVAEVVLSRPGAAHLSGGPDRLIRERSDWLLGVLRCSPGVRSRVAATLATRRVPERTRSLATLLLCPDDAVVDTAIGVLDLAGPPRRDRVGQRAARTIADLRKKVAAERQRREYAQEDARKAAGLLEETRGAMAELVDRADGLAAQLKIEQRRFRDPETLAAALARVLEQPAAPPVEDAAARDPHNTRSPLGEYGDTVLAAARTTGLAPEKVLAVVKAIVNPTPPPLPSAQVAELGLRVTPLGGDTEIGGSCLLVEAGGTRLLIDAGLRPGEHSAPPRDIERALGGVLDAVVVTHAHNDHCGYLPALVARRPDLRILATAETVRLMPVMWADTVKIMKGRARRLSEWSTGTPALYGPDDVAAAARRCEEIPTGVPRRVGDLTIELFRAGHIVGAAGVVIRAGDRRVVVTGDISGFRQESVDGYALPASATDADLLVMESTLCGEEHADRDTRVRDFVRDVREIFQAGGRVLIPAFALGRAQEIALLARRHLPEVPVRIDGMAVDLSTAFETATAGSSRPLTIFGGGVAAADRPAEFDTFRSGIIITTSGMLTGGPAVQWAARILPEAGSAVFLSGYQDEESPGAALRRLAEDGGDFRLTSNGQDLTVPVRARIATLGLSAHADRRGLLTIADEVAAREVMLVHGVQGRQRRFREVLRVRHHATTATGAWRPD